jgi:hypothetical protein
VTLKKYESFALPVKYCQKTHIINIIRPGKQIERARIYRPSLRERTKRSFSVTENERFGLVFAKTGSINSVTDL